MPTFLPNYAQTNNNQQPDLLHTPSMSLPLGLKLPITASESGSTKTPSNSIISHNNRKRPHSPQIEENNNNRVNNQSHTTPSTSSTATAAYITDQHTMKSSSGATSSKKLKSISSKARKPHLHPNHHQQQNTKDHRININSKRMFICL